MAFAVYAFFSGGPGNLQWLYPNELFPTDIRASAVGVIMSLSRIGTIVSTWALPIFINNYGISNTMLMGAGISLFGLLISVAFAPETSRDVTGANQQYDDPRAENGVNCSDFSLF